MTYWGAFPFWMDWEEPGRREVWVCALREGSRGIRFLSDGAECAVSRKTWPVHPRQVVVGSSGLHYSPILHLTLF